MACELKNNGTSDIIQERGIYILKRLLNEKMNDYQMTASQACGVVGNFYAESHTYDPGATNGDHSFGIMQWSAEWGPEMKSWVSARNGGDWKSLRYQVDYLLTADTNYMKYNRSAWVNWCKENPNATPEESAYKFSLDIEGAKGASGIKEVEAQRRKAFARTWADWLKENSIGDCNVNESTYSATGQHKEEQEKDPCEDVDRDISQQLSDINETAASLARQQQQQQQQQEETGRPVNLIYNVLTVEDKTWRNLATQDLWNELCIGDNGRISFKYGKWHQKENSTDFPSVMKTVLNKMKDNLILSNDLHLLILLMYNPAQCGSNIPTIDNFFTNEVKKTLATIYTFFGGNTNRLVPDVFLISSKDCINENRKRILDSFAQTYKADNSRGSKMNFMWSKAESEEYNDEGRSAITIIINYITDNTTKYLTAYPT